MLCSTRKRTRGQRMQEQIDINKMNEILNSHKSEQSSLIPLLQAVQEEYGYVPEAAMDKIAESLNISAGKIYGVVTFYAQFYLKPHGKHKVCICQGTACHVKGAKKVQAKIEEYLGIKEGETTEDMRFSIESVACLGACALAPLVTVDKDYYGNMTPEKVKDALLHKRE